MRSRTKHLFIVLICGITAFLQSAPSAQTADVAKLVRGQVLGANSSAGSATRNRDEVLRFYKDRNYQPAWSAQNAALVLKTLKAASKDGLDPAAYKVTPQKKPKGGAAATAWDINITAAFLRYARDLRTGRVKPNQVYKDLELAKTDFDAPEQLNAALSNGSLPAFIQTLPPQRAEYVFLRDALAFYRAAAKKPWPLMPAMSGDVGGLTVETQTKLWERLAAEDAQLGPLEDEPSLAELEGALRRFQARQGLDADGLLGPNTIATLNIPAARRIALIKANMERWRWLPHVPEKKYIEVNVPSATLQAVTDGEVLLTSNVVIGHRDSKTPILATNVRSIVLNPAWPVPASVASNETYPKLLQNPAYLQEHDMVLVNGPADDPHGLNIDWKKTRRYPFPYVIEQTPSENNALGAFLLDMPNRFDTYLHDTPSKSLFESNARFFSHGCVRVERIAELASFVLLGDPRADIPQRANLPRTKSERLLLAYPTPVYFVYWTAFKSPDGGIAFRNDVYGRDAALMQVLPR